MAGSLATGWQRVINLPRVLINNAAFPCQRKGEGGVEKGLANLWSRQKILKKFRAGSGHETIREITVETYDSFRWNIQSNDDTD